MADPQGQANQNPPGFLPVCLSAGAIADPQGQANQNPLGFLLACLSAGAIAKDKHDAF